MPVKTIHHHHVALWTESFGSIDNPAVLLVPGAGHVFLNAELWTMLQREIERFLAEVNT